MKMKLKIAFGVLAVSLSALSVVSYAEQSIVIRNRVDMPASLPASSWPGITVAAYDGDMPCQVFGVGAHTGASAAYAEFRTQYDGGIGVCKHIDRIHYYIGGLGGGGILSAWFSSPLDGDIKIQQGMQSASYSISDLQSQGGGQVPGDNGDPKGTIVVFNTSA